MKPIWIVDDDQSIRFVLEKALMRENLPTRSFTHPREVLQALTHVSPEDCPQVLVSDIRMPGGSGLDLLAQVKERMPGLPVIIMTAYSDLDSAVSAFQGGAFEYLPKPFDLTKAIELIRRALEESQREAVGAVDVDSTPEMLGQAPAMQDVFRAIGRLSQSNVTVMITGESGSGKELVARALHKHSQRAAGPFVAINTAAIPKDLLESELFGHERGAFTGAQSMRRGRFEQADGGTLFLDEIGDMKFDLQTRLLRVLSDGGRPQCHQNQCARDCRDTPKPGAKGGRRSVSRRLVPSLECDSTAFAAAARAARRHSCVDATFFATKRSTTGCRSQTYF
jgi:two-component system nitrogen regulation response regulator GlnG